MAVNGALKTNGPLTFPSMALERCLALLLTLSLAGTCCDVQAQFWEFVHRMLNGDSTAGPDFDTTYIASYRDDLVLSPIMAHQSASVNLSRTDGNDLGLTTNTPVQYGLALDYKWLGVEYTATIAGLSSIDSDRGATESRGLGFGYTGRKWWFRNMLRQSKGFHVDDPTAVVPDWNEGDPYPYRGDMETVTYMATLNHGSNSRRYSHTAALWQMERQKRSAGSWVVGGTFWFTRTTVDSSLVPLYQRELYEVPITVTSVRRWVVGVTGGYTYTLSLWGRGFANLMVVPGLGAQQQALGTSQGSSMNAGWSTALTAEVRVGAGYVGDHWYIALTAYSFQSTGHVTPDVQLGNGLASARLAAGWRIHHIRPIIPALGL